MFDTDDDDENPLETLPARAESGDVDAQYEMGWRHVLGSGFDRDDEEGLKWIRLAAENGHALAQNNLGARYHAGDGVPQDSVEAYVWFFKAAQQGDRKAGKNCDSVARQLTEEQLAEARNRAAQG